MGQFNFADRYAEAGLSPGGAIIAAREGPANRILQGLNTSQIFDLIGLFFGHADIDLTWFRDEFIKDDPAFSLINNRRECAILAATILGAAVSGGNDVAILGLITASVQGKRAVAEAEWLLQETQSALWMHAVEARKLVQASSVLNLPIAGSLGEEIAGLGANDWPNLVTNLGKLRSEGQQVAKAIADHVSSVVEDVNWQLALSREETQMLWWLFGEFSRTFKRPFDSFSSGAGAIIIGIELGELSTASRLGPIAAPAMLERGLNLMKANRESIALSSAIDSIEPVDLKLLKFPTDGQLYQILPISSALDSAKKNPGHWSAAFETVTGLKAETKFRPIELATQVYYEHLLGQIL